MQKIMVRSPGGYEKLCLESHPDLVATGNQAVVEVQAAGVNYADCCVRWGVYESAKKYVGWPITPGFEFSGTVSSVGNGVSCFKPGDRVMGISFFGAYASQVCVPEKHLFPLPAGFSMEQAAGFPAVFMTAYHALFQLVRLPEKATILVHSAGGGVGSALVQLGRAAGFKVIGVVGAAHKKDYVKALGADEVVDKSGGDLWKRVHELCPEGFDAVLDANGHTTLRKSYEALRPTGKLIAYGSHALLPKGSVSGKLNYVRAAMGLIQTPRFNPMKLISENKSVIGFNLSFLFARDDLLSGGMKALLEEVTQKKITAPQVKCFPLADVGSAHRLIETGQTTGKLVLVLPVSRF